MQNNRFDICCCVQVSKKSDSYEENAAEGTLYKIFQHAYAPFVLSKPVRAIVVVVFFGWLCASIAVAPQIDVGLDQELSMPGDSYMLDYFSVSFQNSVTLLKNSWFSLLWFFSDCSICRNIFPLVLLFISSFVMKVAWTTQTKPCCRSFVVDSAATLTLWSPRSICRRKIRNGLILLQHLLRGSTTTWIGLEMTNAARLTLTLGISVLQSKKVYWFSYKYCQVSDVLW